MNSGLKLFNLDPRWYQISVLSTFFLYGAFWLGLDISLPEAGMILGVTLASQYLFTKWANLPVVEYKSALISGISLCLLLRCSSPLIGVLAAVIAIGSKFLIRFDGRHVFNPTNFAIVAVILMTGEAWVCPGQWGSFAVFALGAACAGFFVVNRSARVDVAVSFLLSYAALLFWRAFWLGDPYTIPIHQLGSGALVIFTFHMISDPKTTPNDPYLRILFGMVVAYLAYYFRFKLFEPNALIYALVLATPIVPLMNKMLKGPWYRWEAPRGVTIS